MTWIKCSDRLPECLGPETFFCGRASDLVIALWLSGNDGHTVSLCRYIDYGSDADQKDDGWMYASDAGHLDRCTSHGGSAPDYWMPYEAPQ